MPSTSSSLFAYSGSNLMAATLHQMARLRPELADRSGVAMWPVPALFPTLLARAVHLLQQTIGGLYVQGDRYRAERLAQVRSIFVQLASSGGDLGEDHCAEFLRDHPRVHHRAAQLGGPLPFDSFLKGLFEVEDPIAFVGAMLRNEEGSPEEIEALLDTKLIAFGRYFQIHHAEEPNHAKLALEISEILAADEGWRDAALSGMFRHDELYSRAGQIAVQAQARA